MSELQEKFKPEEGSIQELAERNVLPPFDYSEIDTTAAAKLHDIENVLLTAKRNYVIATACAVQAAHDLLANYHNGTFTAWHLSIGISRGTAQNMVSVAQLLSNSTLEETEILNDSPASLLYSAAKKDAPSELVKQVKSGDITTNAEYQRLKKELEEAQRKASGMKDSYNAAHKNEEYNIKLRKEAEQQLAGARQALEAAKTRGDKWQAKAGELEKRPVEVAVQEPDPAEIERIRANIEKAATMKLKGVQAENQRLKQQLEHEHGSAMSYNDAEQMTKDFASSMRTYAKTFLMLTKEFDEHQFRSLSTGMLKTAEDMLMDIRAEQTSKENYLEGDEDW